MSGGLKRIRFIFQTFIISVFTFVVTFLYLCPFIVNQIDQNDHIVDQIDQHGELSLKPLAPPISMNDHDVFVRSSWSQIIL